MAEASKKTTAAKSTDADATTWKPTADSKKKATTLRIVALVLWAVAIAAEAVAIFWLLRQRVNVGDVTESGLVRDDETGLLVNQEPTFEFPQWAFITLIVMLVVIAALSIIGSQLWKKANRLDPASQKDKFRFFVQNQLGAIIAIIAFLPLIILIFLNKDMSKNQKMLAGIVGIVLAAGAAAAGVDYDPPSVEKYTADQSTVIQLLGEDKVVWVAGGSVYHVCADVSDITNATSEMSEGTTAEAVAAGKERLTLEFASELRACGLPVPENASDIVSAIREIRDGVEGVVLPQPVYAEGVEAPFTPVG